MNRDFEKCLKNRRIIKQQLSKDLVTKELKVGREDLKRAKKTFDELDFKWATIQAYYAMFHLAKALLFAKGYREKSHACLKFAIQALYVDEGILEQKFVDDFDTTMLLRETADYKSDFSKEGAETATENAEMFLSRTGELLQ